MQDRRAAQPPTLVDGVDLLDAFRAADAAREAAVRDLVGRLADLNRSGVVEMLEGLPIDVLLGVHHKWTRAEVGMLLDAGDVLAAMPATWLLWQDGILTWSVIRDIVTAVRPIGRDGRLHVDGRLASSRDRLPDMDPDQIRWAVEDAVDEVRGAKVKERTEEVDQRESFLAIQLAFDGRSKVYGELDAIDTAVVTGGLDRQTALTDATGHGAHADPAPHQAKKHRRPSRAKLRARALVSLCRSRLDGRTADGTVIAAKPLLIAHVPLDRITATSSGLLEVAVPHSLPRLSAALVESLARTADLKTVVMDGHRPLTVTRKVNAKDVPADVRLAVLARDLGARDPCGTTTIPLSEVHHLNCGRHHVDELVTVSRRGHLRLIHKHGWSGTIHPTTGAVRWTRHDRTITTLPRGTRLAEP